MKKWIGVLILSVFLLRGQAQAFEIEQLLLNVEKLAQLKSMLSDLKKGYETLHNGYTAIRNISEGNFNLHQLFLDKLLQVSPVVRNYKKVSLIISKQLLLVKEYKRAFVHFKQSGQFRADEIHYMERVYFRLIDRSVRNLDALATILTSGVLRLSDDERLQRIDVLHEAMEDMLVFLRHFNRQNSLLELQRAREAIDTKLSKKLQGIGE